MRSNQVSLQKQALNISENIESYLLKLFCTNHLRLLEVLTETLSYPSEKTIEHTKQIKEYKPVLDTYAYFREKSSDLVSKYQGLTERADKARLYREELLPLLTTMLSDKGYFSQLRNYASVAIEQVSQVTNVNTLNFSPGNLVSFQTEKANDQSIKNFKKSINEDISRIKSYFKFLEYNNNNFSFDKDSDAGKANIDYQSEDLYFLLSFYFPQLDLECHNDLEIHAKQGDFQYTLLQATEIISHYAKSIKNYLDTCIFESLIDDTSQLYSEVKDNLEFLTKKPSVDVSFIKETNQIKIIFYNMNFCLQVADSNLKDHIDLICGPLKSYLKLHGGKFNLEIEEDTLELSITAPNLKLLNTVSLHNVPRDFMNHQDSFEISVETSYFGLKHRTLTFVLPNDLYTDESIRQKLSQTIPKLSQIINIFPNYSYIDLSNLFICDEDEPQYGYIDIGEEIPRIRLSAVLLDDSSILSKLQELSRITDIKSLNLDYSPNLIVSPTDLKTFSEKVLTKLIKEVSLIQHAREIQDKSDIIIENELPKNFFSIIGGNTIKIKVYGAIHKIFNF